MKTSLRNAARHVMLVAAALFITSCGREAPTAVQQPSADLLGTLSSTLTTTLQNTQGELLSCSALPYASASALIGPAGGTITVGPHTFKVPAGALSQTVLITATAPSGSARVVNFAPQGLQFASPASLTLNFSGCSLLTQLVPQIAYVNNSLDILNYIPSLANLLSQTVTGQVRHFSGYAVAY